MSTDRFVLNQRTLVLGLAVLAPAAMSVLLSVTSPLVANTSAALVLVLLVVGAASTGLRAAGLLAALSAAASFDYFLTAPYYTLRILDRADIETAVLLLAVGVAVTELALWGRRQQGRASEQSGFLDGVLEAAQEVGGGSATPATVVEHIEHQLVRILDLDAAHFYRVAASDLPRLEPDGRLVEAGRVVDVHRDGLPTDTEIILPVRVGGRHLGEFRLTAATHIARPSVDRRRVAALLADQAGIALDSSDRINRDGSLSR
jgi:K+-sensing histidine kinase KdpD